jgi:hypothetical protein
MEMDIRPVPWQTRAPVCKAMSPKISKRIPPRLCLGCTTECDPSSKGPPLHLFCNEEITRDLPQRGGVSGVLRLAS